MPDGYIRERRPRGKTPASACTGKLSYPTAAAAWRALDAQAGRYRKRRGAPKREPCEPYRCQVCTQWHLGRRGRPSRRRPEVEDFG